ncbi:MAG: protein kinase [Gemmataceae bacterium]
MPPPSNSEEFLELLRKSDLVDDKKLSEHLREIRQGGGLPDKPERLAGLLIRDGFLTHFQAEQLLMGKWRRFSIGKYKVLERLGTGGMGSVYLCEHKLMRRRVAVKVLPTAKAQAKDESSLQRFYREARAVAALDHPNIVHAYDIDQEDNLHFLVMEYVDGASLQEIVRKSGPLDPLRAANYVYQTAFGLAHAHEAGLVHRDVKPGNLLVDRQGTVKVLDMGLARFFNDDEDMLTRKYDENVLGTADYLAPEQAVDSHEADTRADIYSLGATFYFMLTGKPPFEGGTVAQKLIWHQTKSPEPVTKFRQDVPPDLLAILHKMMEKQLEDRYQHPTEVSEALAQWCQTPVPPPTEEEMPRLSRAATGPKTGTSQATSSRRSWQVSGFPKTPAPATQAATSQEPPTQRSSHPNTPQGAPPTIRETAHEGAESPSTTETQQSLHTPPAGQVGSKQTRNAPKLPPLPGSTKEGASERSSARAQAGPGGTASQQQGHAPRHGTGDTPKLPPLPGSGQSEFSQDSRSEARPPLELEGLDEEIRALSEEASGTRLRQPTTPNFNLTLLISLAIGCVFFVVAGIIVWVLLLPSDLEPKGPPAPLKVSRTEEGAFPSIAAALAKAKPGDVIELWDAIYDESITIDQRGGSRTTNITIRPGKNQTVVWQSKETKPLLTLHSAQGFRLEGNRSLTLDGRNEHPFLIRAYGNAPNLVLKDTELKGFTEKGIYVSNLGGTAEKKVQFEGLEFFPQENKNQKAITFDKNRKIQNPSNTNHISVRYCTFGELAPKAAIEIDGTAVLGDDVDLPGGVK